MNYAEFYNQDDRFRRYVDICVKEEKKSLEEVLAMRVIQNVGDYYKANPPKEEPVPVKHDDNNGIGIIECGGC